MLHVLLQYDDHVFWLFVDRIFLTYRLRYHTGITVEDNFPLDYNDGFKDQSVVIDLHKDAENVRRSLYHNMTESYIPAIVSESC